MVKKTAKKTVKNTEKKSDTREPVVVPKGFKPTSNTFAPTWDPANNSEHPSEIIGTWGKEREIEIRRGRGKQKNRLVNVTTDDAVWSVWQSVNLTGLFDEAKEGDTVYIRFDGLGKAKRGQQPPKLFTTGIEE